MQNPSDAPKYIQDKDERLSNFEEKKKGFIKKAFQLSLLTGIEVLALVANSDSGHVSTFATPKAQQMLTKPEGRTLIQSCMNQPEPSETSPSTTSVGWPSEFSQPSGGEWQSKKKEIRFIEEEESRLATYEIRKQEVMKTAYELTVMTGAHVLLLVLSEAGHIYTFASPRLQPVVNKAEGKNLIQTYIAIPFSSLPPPAVTPIAPTACWLGN
eukprot:TRINITY_DN6326_c0_g1_i1.p1 TRINITY_DN6326_c0_g1~~TRINITY_DN6326_c0_g1_i1.p1  ORF type:complete len:225 (+),score=58.72 TRINITY_DN6326_c0_g1_i1:41-676(+)